MTRAPMSMRRLEWLLRARGPAMACWPQADRDAALTLARTEPAARWALADALADEDAPCVDAAGQFRMQCSIRTALAPLGRGVRWGVLLASLAAGLWLGLLPHEAEGVGSLLGTLQASTPATVLAAIEP